MAKSNDLFFDQLKDNLADTASKYALPALLASLGTGAIGGFIARKNKIPLESKKARRKRILRSIFFPAVTTAGALTALGGMRALNAIDTDKIDTAAGVGTLGPLDIIAKNAMLPAGIGMGLQYGAAPEFILPKSREEIIKNLGVSKKFDDLAKKETDLINKQNLISNQLKKFVGRGKKNLFDLEESNGKELFEYFNSSDQNEFRREILNDQLKQQKFKLNERLSKELDEISNQKKIINDEIDRLERLGGKDSPLLAVKDKLDANNQIIGKGKVLLESPKYKGKNKAVKYLLEKLPRVRINSPSFKLLSGLGLGTVGGYLADEAVEKLLY